MSSYPLIVVSGGGYLDGHNTHIARRRGNKYAIDPQHRINVRLPSYLLQKNFPTYPLGFTHSTSVNRIYEDCYIFNLEFLILLSIYLLYSFYYVQGSIPMFSW